MWKLIKTVPLPYRLLGVFGIVLAIIIGFKVWENSLIKKGEVNQQTKTTVVQKQAEVQDLKNVVETERKAGQVNQEKSSDYQDDLAAIDRVYRAELDRLRREAAGSTGVRRDASVPGLPDGSSGSDAEAEARLLAQELATTRTKLTETQAVAERQAYQLLRLQEWIVEQARVYNQNPQVKSSDK